MSPAEYRAHREKLGLTQAGLAALLGIPRESISRRENGEQRITPEAVLALRAIRPKKAKASGGSNDQGHQSQPGASEAATERTESNEN